MSSSVSFPSVFDIEDVIHLEQTFFDTGYADGHGHGRIHGLIEGRALGREKGYELWEEIGFYEGFAMLWQAVCQTNDEMELAIKSRTESHIRHLLDLMSQFPRVNPSALPQGRDGTKDTELDVTELLSRIRARYKALCATVGVKPRLRAVGSSRAAITEDVNGVPETQARKKVWKLDGRRIQASPAEMTF